MGTIARTSKAGGGTNFNSGQTIDPAEVNTDFNTAYTELNGNLDDANIETATIPGAKSLRFTEISDPSAPSSNDLLLFGSDATGSATWLRMKDASGRACQVGRTMFPGLSTGTAVPIAACLTTGTSGYATGANTTETDTISYTMPANTLNAVGDSIEFIVHVRTAANGNNKRFRAYLGSTAIFDTTAVAWNNQSALIAVRVWRINSASEFVAAAYTRGTAGTESAPQFYTNASSTTTENLATNLALRFTMLNGTASAADCSVDFVQVRWFGVA